MLMNQAEHWKLRLGVLDRRFCQSVYQSVHRGILALHQSSTVSIWIIT